MKQQPRETKTSNLQPWPAGGWTKWAETYFAEKGLPECQKKIERGPEGGGKYSESQIKTLVRDAGEEYERWFWEHKLSKLLVSETAYSYTKSVLDAAIIRDEETKDAGLNPAIKVDDLIHKTQRSRWESGQQKPDGGAFFALQTVYFQQEVHEIEDLPSRRAAIWDSVQRTLGVLLMDEFGVFQEGASKPDQKKKPARWIFKPTKEEFAYVRWFVRHKDSESALPGQTPDYQKLTVVSKDVFGKLHSIGLGYSSFGVERLTAAFTRWWRPYMLFKRCIDSALWSDFDEDPV